MFCDTAYTGICGVYTVYPDVRFPCHAYGPYALPSSDHSFISFSVFSSEFDALGDDLALDEDSSYLDAATAPSVPEAAPASVSTAPVVILSIPRLFVCPYRCDQDTTMSLSF